MNRESINSPASQNSNIEDISIPANKVHSLRHKPPKNSSELCLDLLDHPTQKSSPSQYADDVGVLAHKAIEDR